MAATHASATIPVTRSRAEAARLLVQTADRWGQPVPAGVRELAKALDTVPADQAHRPSVIAMDELPEFVDQEPRNPNTDALLAIGQTLREAQSLWASQDSATIEKAVNELYDQGLLKATEAAAIFLALTSAGIGAPTES
jgi:hypothetical protein